MTKAPYAPLTGRPTGWRCARKACEQPRAPVQIFCKPCWFTVPKQLRDEVWKAYKHEPGGEAHLEAIRKAIEAANLAAA